MIKDEILEAVIKDCKDVANYYDLGNADIQNIVSNVIDEGIEGFKYTLITPNSVSFYNHKILTIKGIHLDVSNMMDYFITVLEKKYKRWYPEHVDRALGTYENAYIDKHVFDSAIDHIKEHWNIIDYKYLPVKEPGTKPGYVISLKKLGD